MFKELILESWGHFLFMSSMTPPPLQEFEYCTSMKNPQASEKKLAELMIVA